MRLLFVSPFVPGLGAGHAGGVTLFGFLDGLARRGHEVHLVSLLRETERRLVPELEARLASVRLHPIAHGHDASPLRRLRHFARLALALAGGLVARRPAYVLRYWYPGFERMLAEAVREVRPDLIQIEYLQLAPLRRLLPRGIPVVLDTHEVQTPVAFRALASARWPARAYHALQLGAWMELQAGLEGFSRVLAISEADAAALLAFAPRLPVEVLPHGIDCEAYRPGLGAKEADSLVFVGSFDHHQNLDSARLLLDVVMPGVWRGAPAARLHLVGNHPPRWLMRRAGERVVVPGFVPDLPGYVGGKRVFVAPLRQGAGLKIKLLQALALGLPVVTTPEGAEGIGLTHGEDALIAENPEGCAELCLQALRDEHLRQRLGQAGRRLVEHRFATATAATALETLLLKIKNP